MLRLTSTAAVLVAALWLAGPAAAQESDAAKATRKKLQQKVTIDIKEIGTKQFLEDINLELEKPLKFTIDNKTGVSNNTKMTYKGKGVTVEKLLNDLADKYDWGWVVISNPSNNKVDGSVVIRKSKERGYEAGKEPKKGASLDAPERGTPRDEPAVTAGRGVIVGVARPRVTVRVR